MVFINTRRNSPLPIVSHNSRNSLLHGIDANCAYDQFYEVIGGALLLLFFIFSFVFVFVFFYRFCCFFVSVSFLLLLLVLLFMFFDLNWIWNILHLIQAMKIELPVIARRNDGNAAIIDDDKTGLLFDTPEVCLATF